ncbi:MAG: hypothetical protein KKF65_02465, partial [Nanoarchaeota archaeon]|nr:hypothetical protein [Nanoarchaeota archaeon]
MSMIIIGVVLILVIMAGLLVVVSDSAADKKASQMKSFAFELQRELILASEVHEGYSREIFIPTYIGKNDFTMN